MAANSKDKKFSANGCPLDSGKLLYDYYKKKGIRWAPLSRALNRNINTVMGYRKQKSMQTALLWEISKVLKHNFLADLAAQLPKEWSTDVPADTSIADERDQLKARISELERQLEIVTAERDVLVRVGR